MGLCNLDCGVCVSGGGGGLCWNVALGPSYCTNPKGKRPKEDEPAKGQDRTQREAESLKTDLETGQFLTSLFCLQKCLHRTMWDAAGKPLREVGRQVEAGMSEKGQSSQRLRTVSVKESHESQVHQTTERVIAKMIEVWRIDTGSRGVPVKNNLKGILRRW